eukprot:365400-Alexandrium_andersonii.AAC.1
MVLGLLGLRENGPGRDETDRQGHPRVFRDQRPALKEDPRGGWLRDLTQEGVEPNLGPRGDPWRPCGRHHELDHLRPS